MTESKEKVENVSSTRSEGQAHWISVLELGAIGIARHKSDANMLPAKQRPLYQHALDEDNVNE